MSARRNDASTSARPSLKHRAAWATLALLLSVAVVLVALPGKASAAAGLPTGVSLGGKPMGVPGFAAIWGEPGGTVSIPPPVGLTFITDGNEVYDSSVTMVFEFSGTAQLDATVTAEQFNLVEATIYVNQTRGNFTATVPEQVQLQTDIQWSNESVALVPRSFSYVVLPLPQTPVEKHLVISVAGASWGLTHLTPVTNSLAGYYSTGGLDLLLLVEALITAGILLPVAGLARSVARRVHYVPKPKLVWPAFWAVPPIVGFSFFYQPTNETFGIVSPFVYPAFFAIAAFPYLLRLFRDAKLAEFTGFKARTSTSAVMPVVDLNVVQTENGLRCAPETWREVLYTLGGVPLPEVQMDTVASAGIELKIEPAGLPVEYPLESGGGIVDIDIIYWFDATKGIRRVRHRFTWWTQEEISEVEESADGAKVEKKRKVRRFRPHVERGYLRGAFPPIKDVAEFFAGVRSVEQEAMDHERDRLLVAELRGRLRHSAREYAQKEIEAYERAHQLGLGERPPSEREHLVQRSRRESGGRGDAPSA
ncbi:MAG TPA: hypothetical protein VGV89_01570 [Thermoplasmata archaeon]|nr:hypothetical protein [Thermoplasmata archaeon]